MRQHFALLQDQAVTPAQYAAGSSSAHVAVLTVSDSRTEETDTSGRMVVEGLGAAGHELAGKVIVRDNIYDIRARVSQWIADPKVRVVIINGGTGMTLRDVTPEAVRPLLDKEMEGFGELFRQLSYEEVRTSTIQSRAFAGIANGTLIFCLPGSTSACRLAWEGIIKHQLDSNHQPCNFINLFPRLGPAG